MEWLIKETNAKDAPQNIGPYSQGIVVGPFVFTSGEGPLDPVTGKIVDGVEVDVLALLVSL